MALSFSKMKKAIDVVIKSGHVPNIVGLQGIGKTDLVREYAKEHGYPFTEITCSLIQEGDLAMPYVQKGISGEGDVAYSVNRIIRDICEESQGKECGILFLDEFNRTSSQVQSELMNLVHQRRVVDYKLSDNVVIVLAMNPSAEMEGYEESNYSVSFSDKAISGRVVFLHMDPKVSDWLEYGEKIVNGRELVHPVLHSFISANPSFFYTEEVEGKLNSTPRGWSRVSDIVYTYEKSGLDDQDIFREMIRGTVETEGADAFIRFYKRSASGVDYYSVARRTLNAESKNDWDMTSLCKMNDADLIKVFNAMIESADHTNATHVRNVKEFCIMASPELGYALHQNVSAKNNSLYQELVKYDDFAQYVLNLVVNIRNTEVGGFQGKPD